MYPPLIFLPDELYERIQKHGMSDADAWAVIVHERAHLFRIGKTIPIIGPLIFGYRFIVGDKKFTLEEELYAIHEEMKYRKSKNIPYDIERKARQFSSSLYRNLLPYEEARLRLEDLWKNVV